VEFELVDSVGNIVVSIVEHMMLNIQASLDNHQPLAWASLGLAFGFVDNKKLGNVVHIGRHSLGIEDMRFAWASLGRPSLVVASSFLVVVDNKMLDNVVRTGHRNRGIVGKHFASERPSWVVASSFLVVVGNTMLDNVVRIGQHIQGTVGMLRPLA